MDSENLEFAEIVKAWPSQMGTFNSMFHGDLLIIYMCMYLFT